MVDFLVFIGSDRVILDLTGFYWVSKNGLTGGPEAERLQRESGDQGGADFQAVADVHLVDGGHDLRRHRRVALAVLTQLVPGFVFTGFLQVHNGSTRLGSLALGPPLREPECSMKCLEHWVYLVGYGRQDVDDPDAQEIDQRCAHFGVLF